MTLTTYYLIYGIKVDGGLIEECERYKYPENCELDEYCNWVGVPIWSTESINVFEMEEARGSLPAYNVSQEQMREANELITEFKLQYPVSLTDRLPPIGFYWCVLSS